MAQKKKKNRKQGHPGRQQQTHGISASQAAVQRAMDRIIPEYLRWYEDAREDAGLSLGYLNIIQTIFVINANAHGETSVTNFAPAQFAEIFETIVELEEETDTPIGNVDAVTVVQNAVTSYVDFLTETDRWEGSEEALAILQELVGNVLSGVPLEDDPEALSSMEAMAVGDLSAMKVVELGRQMVRWIGTGRAVETSGELAPNDEREATALIDSQITGQHTPTSELLLQLYLALAVAEVIELEEQQVRPSAGAVDFLSDDPAVAFGSLFSFVHAFLEEALMPPDSDEATSLQAWRLLHESLGMATANNPVGVGAEVPEDIDAEAWQEMLERMEELATLGLVTKDTHYDVPLAVGALLESIFEEGNAALDAGLFATPENLESTGHADDQSNVITLPSAEAASGAVLQLKLGLKYAKPPIWRRVLISPQSTLAQLHEVIQVSFGWNEAHMHDFQLKPAQAKNLPTNNGELDESAVSIGQLLKAEKDKIGYIYDFGDNWELEIVVEKILDDESEALPRCTGGRRMAPLEDSGGIPGWERMLEAIKDPTHEMYRDYREWLGLEEAEQLDGSIFDQAKINRKLEYLR